MDARGKAIRVNAASIVDLKAELIRKQGEFKKEKLQTSATPKPKVSSKKTGIFSKSNAGVAERSQRDVEQLAEDQKNHDKARAALEEKAKLYDKMMKSSTIPDEDGSGVFLVDFQKKVLDKVKAQATEDAGKAGGAVEVQRSPEDNAEDEDIPEPSDPEEQWVDYVDSLGRSRRCMKKDLAALQDMDRRLGGNNSQGSKDLMSADMIREEQRQKWEQEEQEALNQPVGPVHYQQVRHNEVRDLGVGYYSFSKEETERQKQMETLNMLREETLDQRVKREKLKEKRKAALQARLAKVKQRKAKKLKGEGGEEEEGQELEEGSPGAGEEEKAAEPEPEPLHRDESWRRSAPLRDWDKGKERHFPWIKTKEELEDERPAEFAPPKEYHVSSPSQQLQPQKRNVLWKKKQSKSTTSTNVEPEKTSPQQTATTQDYHLPKQEGPSTQPLLSHPPPPPTMQYPSFPPPPYTIQSGFPPPYMQGWPPYPPPPPPMAFNMSAAPNYQTQPPPVSSIATNTMTSGQNYSQPATETTSQTSASSTSQQDVLDSALSYFRKLPTEK